MKIRLYYKYLKHDIDQLTYRAGGLIDDAQGRDSAQAGNTETDTSFYRRKCEDGVAHLKTILDDRLEKVTADTGDMLDMEKASWLFSVITDKSFNVDAEALCELMHRFVVWHVLRDWTVLYAPDRAGAMAEELGKIEGIIKENLYTLSLPVKHRRKKLMFNSEVCIEDEDEYTNNDVTIE